jgi:hypothetical protein
MLCHIHKNNQCDDLQNNFAIGHTPWSNEPILTLVGNE